MSFLFTPLLWIGLSLIALPVLIHLINLRRHRRIRWAAMEFLLQSQKRHKKWILLKQLFLLLLRMAAIAAVALMVAQPVLRSEWGELLGGATTHHLILLDDSYSMTDRVGEASAFDRAKQVVQQIAKHADAEGGSQLFSIFRFSEIPRLSAGSQPDLFREMVDDSTDGRLEAILGPLDASETDAGPVEAFEALARLPKAAEDETLIVYLVTDFRERQWSQAGELRRQLLQLQGDGVRLHLVNCTNETHPNLAITALRPLSGLHAAGVETWMEMVVANYGDQAARGVTVQLAEDGHPRAAIELDAIPARDELTHRFRVNWPTAGPHAIKATLPDDAIAVDSQRFYAAEIPNEVPILVIDGTTTGEDGRFISTSLAPGGPVKTGWRPRVEPPSFIRETEKLADYAAIFLLDVPRLDAPEVEALEQYVRGGGGVACFVGERTDRGHVNAQWYRGAEGFFPVPLRLPTQLLTLADEGSPDVSVADHPIFRVFAGKRNSFLQLLLVDYYYAVDPDWKVSPDGQTQVVARLRNRGPLVIEKKLGDGRVLAFLTKASPEPTSLGQWNNWGNNPAYPVIINELAGHLAMNWHREPARLVGEPIQIVLDESEYTPELTFHIPTADATEVLPITATPKDGVPTAELATVPRSGVYAVDLNRQDGREQHRQFAVNVPNGEGDLTATPRSDIESRLEGVRFLYHRATDFAERAPELAGFRLSDTILYALLGILLIEQFLAYVLSYHPKVTSQT